MLALKYVLKSLKYTVDIGCYLAGLGNPSPRENFKAIKVLMYCSIIDQFFTVLLQEITKL